MDKGKRMSPKMKEAIGILLAMKQGKKLKSKFRFWDWMQPYLVTLAGKEVTAELCGYMERKKLVEVEKVRGSVSWLKVAPEGEKMLIESKQAEAEQ